MFQNKIPKSCRENWLELSSNEKIRFCNLCQKNILENSDDEIQNIDNLCMRYPSPIDRDNKSLIQKLKKFFALKNKASF